MNRDSLGQPSSAPGAYYRIKVKGVLEQVLPAPLSNLQIQREGDITTLFGYMRDRTMLHSLLAQMRRLNLPVRWVQCVKSGDLFHQNQA